MCDRLNSWNSFTYSIPAGLRFDGSASKSMAGRSRPVVGSMALLISWPAEL